MQLVSPRVRQALERGKGNGEMMGNPVLSLHSGQAKGREERVKNCSKSADGAGDPPAHQLTRHGRAVISVHPLLSLPTCRSRFLVF